MKHTLIVWVVCIWNLTAAVPFLPVIWHPGRNWVCFACVLGTQLVGLVGESLMLANLPAGRALLRASGGRFIAFDAAGLVLVGLAFGFLFLRHETTGVVGSDQ